MAITDQFRHKTVCMLSCRFCSTHVCKRGMKAMLLADMTVELYSTDIPPSSVQLVGTDFKTNMCSCKIRDIACLTCGNVIGYHITMPCQVCLHSCNNGHFWMFRTEGVVAADRLNGIGNRLLLWGQLPKPDLDGDSPCKIWTNPPKEVTEDQNEYHATVISVGYDVYDSMCR
ncbi:unnamed protein product [Umbelopsis ramanniana]